jgi:hypothetical protein
MKLDVRIERLVLNGVAVGAADHPLLRAAIEAELARLLATGGLAPELLAGGGVAWLPAGTVAVEGQPDPGQLGARIAGAVHGGIGP